MGECQLSYQEKMVRVFLLVLSALSVRSLPNNVWGETIHIGRDLKSIDGDALPSEQTDIKENLIVDDVITYEKNEVPNTPISEDMALNDEAYAVTKPEMIEKVALLNDNNNNETEIHVENYQDDEVVEEIASTDNYGIVPENEDGLMMPETEPENIESAKVSDSILLNFNNNSVEPDEDRTLLELEEIISEEGKFDATDSGASVAPTENQPIDHETIRNEDNTQDELTNMPENKTLTNFVSETPDEEYSLINNVSLANKTSNMSDTIMIGPHEVIIVEVPFRGHPASFMDNTDYPMQPFVPTSDDYIYESGIDMNEAPIGFMNYGVPDDDYNDLFSNMPGANLPMYPISDVSFNEGPPLDAFHPIPSETSENREILTSVLSPSISKSTDFPVNDSKTEDQVDEPWSAASGASHTVNVSASLTLHPTGEVDVKARIEPVGDEKLFTSFFNKYIGKFNSKHFTLPRERDLNTVSRGLPSAYDWPLTHPIFPFHGPYEYEDNFNHEHPNEIDHPHEFNTMDSLNYYDEPSQLLYEDSYF